MDYWVPCSVDMPNFDRSRNLENILFYLEKTCRKPGEPYPKISENHGYSPECHWPKY